MEAQQQTALFHLALLPPRCREHQEGALCILHLQGGIQEVGRHDGKRGGLCLGEKKGLDSLDSDFRNLEGSGAGRKKGMRMGTSVSRRTCAASVVLLVFAQALRKSLRMLGGRWWPAAFMCL